MYVLGSQFSVETFYIAGGTQAFSESGGVEEGRETLVREQYTNIRTSSLELVKKRCDYIHWHGFEVAYMVGFCLPSCLFELAQERGLCSMDG